MAILQFITIYNKFMTPSQQKKKISKLYKQILETLNLDTESDLSLKGTPDRIAKMFVDEIFYGLDVNNYPKISHFPNEIKKYQYEGMVIEKSITIHSVCEHHFQPIIGFAKIAYIPKDKIIGLSKLNRIADFWARRPQVQERLTQMIFEDLKKQLNTDDVAIQIDAEHMCVKLRGVKDQNSETRTTCLGGAFKDDSKAREEFLNY